MAIENLPIVLRILDNENRLGERADQKSISMLSILGVFMVFFVVHYHIMPINIFTAVMITLYLFFALWAIISLIMAIRPRLKSSPAGAADGDKAVVSCDPAFFTGICTFENTAAYKSALEEALKDNSQVANIYVGQIFSVARINAVKYKNVQRGSLLVICALIIELALIAYLFFYYMDAGKMPPLS